MGFCLPVEWPFVFEDPFIATEDRRVPFAEFDTAALCRGEGPDPFENGLEVPFELLFSPSNLILGPWRLRLSRWSLSFACALTEPLGFSRRLSCSPDSSGLSRCRRPRIWFCAGRRSGDPSDDVLAEELLAEEFEFSRFNMCCRCWLLGFGAEDLVLVGSRGAVGVDGSS